MALPAQRGVAVAGFETDGSVGLRRADYPALAMALGATLSEELALRGARVVVVPSLAPDRQGHLDLAAARAAAGRAGAALLGVGQLTDQYGDIHLELRLIDVASGEPVDVIRGDEAHHAREALALALGSLANALTQRPGIGGTPQAPTPVPVEALLDLGRGLQLEAAGDAAGAREAFRRAADRAGEFSALAAARRRVGG